MIPSLFWAYRVPSCTALTPDTIAAVLLVGALASRDKAAAKCGTCAENWAGELHDEVELSRAQASSWFSHRVRVCVDEPLCHFAMLVYVEWPRTLRSG